VRQPWRLERRQLSHRRRRANRLVRWRQSSEADRDPSGHRQIAIVEMAMPVRVPLFRARTTHASADGDLLLQWRVEFASLHVSHSSLMAATWSRSLSCPFAVIATLQPWRKAIVQRWQSGGAVQQSVYQRAWSTHTEPDCYLPSSIVRSLVWSGLSLSETCRSSTGARRPSAIACATATWYAARRSYVDLRRRYDVIVIYPPGVASRYFTWWILKERPWKSDHDFPIAFHSNFLSAMHSFRDNEVLLPTEYDVIVISPSGVTSRNFKWRILKARPWIPSQFNICVFDVQCARTLNSSEFLTLLFVVCYRTHKTLTQCMIHN